MSGLPNKFSPSSSSSPMRGGKTTSTRQLLRQQRELEEKRKFGLAPLAVDTVSNKEISPNIPQSIAQAPWYYGATGPTLDHQRKHSPSGAGGKSEDLLLQDNTDRVVVLGQATRFVPGACKNCGSRTHKTNECTQAKKRVGAKYTNAVTGVDTLVQRAERADGQKRDRFVGDVGVDLLRGQQQPPGDGEAAEDREEEDDDATAHKRRRPEAVFSSRGAQHGGVDIQELPKYLQNLDQQEEIFFDPKTGSMRGNPNANDPTKAFQGDLARYQSGDFYNYVEAQHRYLTGKSKSFVDFALDRELNAQNGVRVEEDEPTTTTNGQATASAPEASAHDVLVRALYGEAAPSVTSIRAAPVPPSPPPASATPLVTSGATAGAEPAADSRTSSALAAATLHERLVTTTAMSISSTRGNGHTSIYGSYLDLDSLQWGYGCCKTTQRDSPCCPSP